MASPRQRVRVSNGVYKDQHGLAAIVSVKGKLTEKRFKPGTSLKTIQTWRDNTKAVLNAQTAPRARRLLSADVKTFLERHASMPSFVDRKRELNRWVTDLRDQPRGTITRDQLAAVIAQWVKAGAAPSTIQKRCTALSKLYTELDGRGGSNPVRDLELERPPDPEPRAIPYALALKILDAMPESKTKYRLRVMLETGLPHAQLGKMQPEDIEDGTLLLRRRRKGKGRAPLRVPLTPSAVAALKTFAREKCWGKFSNSSLHTSFRRACENLLKDEDAEWTDTERASLTAARPYDLRHTFGTEAFRATGDLATVQLLMGHASPQTTRIYTLAGVAEHLNQARDKLAVHLAAAGNGTKSP